MRDTSLIYYQRLWEDMLVAPTWHSRIAAEGKRWLDQKHLYMGYRDKNGSYIPWWLVAAMHDQEASNNPRCQIWNGEPWNQRTVLVPVGKGPWSSFQSSTSDFFAAREIAVTTIPEGLAFLERHNGLGYAKKDKHTPYLWTGCQYGVGTGLYVADGKYSATAEAKQAGLAPTLYWVLNQCHAGLRRGLTGESVLALQKYLNTLGAGLVEDGICGKVTLAAAKAFVTE